MLYVWTAEIKESDFMGGHEVTDNEPKASTPLSPEEVNERVARKLGWTYKEPPEISDSLPMPWTDPQGERRHILPDFSRRIEAAWTIVDKLGPYFVIGKDGNEWVVVDGWNDDYSEERARADTAPMAIALCFLKLP